MAVPSLWYTAKFVKIRTGILVGCTKSCPFLHSGKILSYLPPLMLCSETSPTALDAALLPWSKPNSSNSNRPQQAGGGDVGAGALVFLVAVVEEEEEDDDLILDFFFFFRFGEGGKSSLLL